MHFQKTVVTDTAWCIFWSGYVGIVSTLEKGSHFISPPCKGLAQLLLSRLALHPLGRAKGIFKARLLRKSSNNSNDPHIAQQSSHT